ncbi:TonB-dependent receptor domain-containing protein [Teredinibacter purpureus]|uniref:TonB-dependent receptor domain-containing protein n=1 Tax=Teredinibacter purpureus TaxID=2731756 RepID=UPI00069700CC|nr:TonB-dependent receptor [Teredinibacter purpureus]
MGAYPANFKKKLLVTSISSCLLASAGLVVAQDDPMEEELIVRGIRSSLERSIDIKRESNQIVEAITADDIGKMPDQNVAESLQRLPGVQIDRRDGEGTKVRIRGLSQNVTLLNGNGFVSGMEYFQIGEAKTEYGGSLEGIPSELLGGLEVYKSPTASIIEGGMGGVVNLKTRDPLMLKDTLFAANLKLDQGSTSSEVSPSGFIVAGKAWDDFAAIVSLTANQKTVATDVYDANTRGVRMITMPSTYTTTDGDGEEVTLPIMSSNAGENYVAPALAYISDHQMERERVGASLNLAWNVSDSVTLGFDWFHSDLNITAESYTVKHTFRDNNDNLNDRDEVVDATLLDVGQDFNILTGARVSMGEGETNSAGEVFESTSDNFVFKINATPNDRVTLSGDITYATSEVDQRAGYADTRFDQYRMTRWVGTDGDAGGTPTGWGPSPAGNPSAPVNSVFFYDSSSGGMPVIGFEDTQSLSDVNGLLYKSHWALGSTAKVDNIAVRGDVEIDIDGNRLKTMKFGFRHANETTEFDELRYMSDYSQTEGAMSPTLYNSDGSIASATTFNPNVAPGENMNNVGIREAVYYDLCGNGGLPAGRTCDINGDGFDDNQTFGPYGYFMDAAIGSKSFDLLERLYITDADGDVTDPAVVAAFEAAAPNWFAADPGGKAYALDEDDEVVYLARPMSVSLYGIDTDIDWERWRNSPGYLPWETYAENPGRSTVVSDFYSSGAYNTRDLVVSDASQITSGVEAWRASLTPNTPGSWFQVPFESWKVEQVTDAFYSEFDFEGVDIPYTLNMGVRVVGTTVSVTKATVDNPEATTWSIASDGWNSQGVLLDWGTSTETTTYWDVLPSLNYNLDLTDDTKLRVTAAKVIARPSLQDLGKGFSKNFTRNDESGSTFYQFIGGSDGNPTLDPFRAKQVDVMYEWYFGELGMLSGGLFFKSIDSFIEGGSVDHTEADGNPMSDDGTSTAPVTKPVNGDGGSVNGMELQIQQAWDNGFGASFNYTYSASNTTSSTDSDQNYGLPGVSENAYNLMAFYETEMMSARLAYSWRDDFVSPDRANSGVANSPYTLTEKFDAYGQWDAQLTYNVLDNLSVTVEGINLTEEDQNAYMGWKQLPSQYVNQERRLVLGVTYRM